MTGHSKRIWNDCKKMMVKNIWEREGGSRKTNDMLTWYTKYDHNVLRSVWMAACVCVCDYMYTRAYKCMWSKLLSFVCLCVAVVFVAPFNEAASNSRLLHIFQRILCVADTTKKNSKEKRKHEKRITAKVFFVLVLDQLSRRSQFSWSVSRSVDLDWMIDWLVGWVAGRLD